MAGNAPLQQKKVSSLVSTPPFYIESSPTTPLCAAHFLTGDASPELPFHFPSRRPVRPRVIRCLSGPGYLPFCPRGRRQCRVGVGGTASFSFNLAASHSQAQEAELHRTRLPRDLGRRLHRQFPAYIVRKYTARREEEKNQLDCKGKEKGYPERENRRRMSCCTAEGFFAFSQLGGERDIGRENCQGRTPFRLHFLSFR